MSDPLIASHRIYTGNVVSLDVDQVRFPDGTTGEMEIIRHSGAAAILPFLTDPAGEDPQIMLLRQYRYAAGGYLYEVPAGKLEKDESPSHCAERELREETGCSAQRIEPMFSFLTTPGFTDEVIHSFMATGLTTGEKHLEADEFSEVVTFKLSHALRMIQTNARPENLLYRYDYFVDNCSTRPRDILDRVLGGQFRAKADSLTGLSYRGQALRLMQGDKPLIVGVDIALGEPSDEVLTTWKAMFLPRVLHDYAATLQVRDSAGGLHPLVRGERVLFQSTRPAEPVAPPRLWSYLLLIGLFVGGLLVWLASKAGRSGGARVTLAILATLWCFIAGLLGVVLTLLWTWTDHRFAHANENLLVFNPLWLILAVCVAIYVASGKAARFTGLLAAFLAGLTLVALLAHAVFVSRQANLAVILLGLPPALALSLITWTPSRRTS